MAAVTGEDRLQRAARLLSTRSAQSTVIVSVAITVLAVGAFFVGEWRGSQESDAQYTARMAAIDQEKAEILQANRTVADKVAAQFVWLPEAERDLAALLVELNAGNFANAARGRKDCTSQRGGQVCFFPLWAAKPTENEIPPIRNSRR